MFFVSDIPPELPVMEARVMCSVEAGARYQLPYDLIFAISLTEGGKAGSKVKNKNGTYDLGYMQFNTAYLESLYPYGITDLDVLGNTCYPFHLAAWRISQHLQEQTNDDLLTKIAYYHSRTEKFNTNYQQKLLENIDKIYEYKDLIEKYEQRYQIKINQQYAKTQVIQEDETFDLSNLVLEPKADDATLANFLANTRLVIIPERVRGEQ